MVLVWNWDPVKLHDLFCFFFLCTSLNRLGVLGLLRDKYNYFLCSTDGGQDNNNEDAPENNPSYTTVYVGNLPHDVS